MGCSAWAAPKCSDLDTVCTQGTAAKTTRPVCCQPRPVTTCCCRYVDGLQSCWLSSRTNCSCTPASNDALLTGYRTQTRASSSWSGGVTPSACKPHTAEMCRAVPCRSCFCSRCITHWHSQCTIPTIPHSIKKKEPVHTLATLQTCSEHQILGRRPRTPAVSTCNLNTQHCSKGLIRVPHLQYTCTVATSNSLISWVQSSPSHCVPAPGL